MQPLSFTSRLTSVTVVVTKTITSVVVSMTTGPSAGEVLMVVPGAGDIEDEVEEVVDGGVATLSDEVVAEEVVPELVDGDALVEEVVVEEAELGLMEDVLLVDGGASVPEGVADWPSLPPAVTDVVLAAGIIDDNALDAGGGVPGSVVKTSSLFTAQKLSTYACGLAATNSLHDDHWLDMFKAGQLSSTKVGPAQVPLDTRTRRK